MRRRGGTGRGRFPGGTGRSRVPTWIPPWRAGLPERPHEDPVAPGTGAPRPLAEVLEGLLATGPWRMGLAAGELGRRWIDVVGAPLARETTPVKLDATGTLTVRASSGAWAAQLRFLTEQVRANANDALGTEAVRDVRIVVGGPDGAPRGDRDRGPAERPGERPVRDPEGP